MKKIAYRSLVVIVCILAGLSIWGLLMSPIAWVIMKQAFCVMLYIVAGAIGMFCFLKFTTWLWKKGNK